MLTKFDVHLAIMVGLESCTHSGELGVLKGNFPEDVKWVAEY